MNGESETPGTDILGCMLVIRQRLHEQDSMLLPESNNRVSVHMLSVSWGSYEADIEEGANNRGREVVLG